MVVPSPWRAPIAIAWIVSCAVQGEPLRLTISGDSHTRVGGGGCDVLDAEVIEVQPPCANIPGEFACHGGRGMTMIMRGLPRFLLRAPFPELRHAACQIARNGHLCGLVHEQTGVIAQRHDSARVVRVP